MATQKSQQSLESKMNGNGKKGMSSTSNADDLFALKTGFTPLFSTSHAVEEDCLDVPIKGTGLLIYQGYIKDVISWFDKDKEVEKASEITRHMFAVKAFTGSWKCIDITMNQWNKGNAYDRFLKRMGIDNIFIEVDDANKIPGFLKNFVPNESLINEGLEKMRGMGFLAILERKVKKNGAKIYDILIDSIEPLCVGEVHTRLQSAETTDPQAKTIYSLDAAE